jgi:hypothetical protein
MNTDKVNGMCAHTLKDTWKLRDGGNPSHIQSSMGKTWKDNGKVEKNGQIINQELAHELEHDKIWTQWVLDILLENMLEKVWWCKRSKMEF